MTENLDAKVVLRQTVLHGSNDDFLQRVATVYINGREYRVLAPRREGKFTRMVLSLQRQTMGGPQFGSRDSRFLRYLCSQASQRRTRC
jgi:hypothetical protein